MIEGRYIILMLVLYCWGCSSPVSGDKVQQRIISPDTIASSTSEIKPASTIVNDIGSVIHESQPSSSSEPNLSPGTCEDGAKKAIADAKKGIYKFYTYEFICYHPSNPYDSEFDIFYTEFLETKYGISKGYNGCVIYKELECYRNKMEELIYLKFGKDIFKKAIEKAKIEYRRQIQKKIDTGFIFNWVDTFPEFIGGSDSLGSLFSEGSGGLDCHFGFGDDPSECKGIVKVAFVVEENGSPSHISILKGLSNRCDEQTIRNVRKMHFTPGMHYGKSVRVRMILPIEYAVED